MRPAQYFFPIWKLIKNRGVGGDFLGSTGSPFITKELGLGAKEVINLNGAAGGSRVALTRISLHHQHRSPDSEAGWSVRFYSAREFMPLCVV